MSILRWFGYFERMAKRIFSGKCVFGSEWLAQPRKRKLSQQLKEYSERKEYEFGIDENKCI